MLYMNKSKSGDIFYSENILKNEELIHLILNYIQYNTLLSVKIQTDNDTNDKIILKQRGLSYRS